MTVYYNENDPKAAQWLRNLIAAGHIAKGDVDDRSILDVRPSDLIGYVQCHFFAGIGVWSYALRRAGWPDTRPVWTGSCPCQPFSAAGQGAGFDDERHLWPAWEWLQRHAKPRSVPLFGEQVASKAGLAWLDLVQADLEGQGYTVRALDTCAAGVGAPHIRQRIYFVADTDEGRSRRHPRAVSGEEGGAGREVRRVADGAESRGAVGQLADTNGGHASAEGLQRGRQHGLEPQDGSAGGLADAARASDGRLHRGRQDEGSAAEPAGRSATGGMANADVGARGQGHTLGEGRDHRSDAVQGAGSGGRGRTDVVGHADDAGPQGRGVSGADCERLGADQRTARTPSASGVVGVANGVQPEQPARAGAGPEGEGSAGPCGELAGSGPTAGFWRDADWLPCLDGKSRPVEPGTFPLAHGIAGRVVRLRAYGNALNAEQACEFIRAYEEDRLLAQLG